MTTLTSPTIRFSLYLSGPIEVAKQLLRQDCMREGLCVTISPTSYLYTGGEETGYVVGLVNYPRFPMSLEALEQRARALALALLNGTYQHSVLIVGPATSEWITKRQ